MDSRYTFEFEDKVCLVRCRCCDKEWKFHSKQRSQYENPEDHMCSALPARITRSTTKTNGTSVTSGTSGVDAKDKLIFELTQTVRHLSEKLAGGNNTTYIDSRSVNTYNIFNYGEGIPQCINLLERLMSPENIKQLNCHPIELLCQEAEKHPEVQHLRDILFPEKLEQARNAIGSRYQELANNAKKVAIENGDTNLHAKIMELQI